MLADLVEKGVAAEADVVQQLRQVLPAEVMDLVPAELKRWALCKACWAEDGMQGSLRGADLRWLSVSSHYTLGPVPEQRHWSSAAAMGVGRKREAGADCLWLQGCANDASAGRDADGAGPVRGASPDSGADERQPGRRVLHLLLLRCMHLPALCRAWRAGACAHACNWGKRGSAGFVGGPVSEKVDVLTTWRTAVSTSNGTTSPDGQPCSGGICLVECPTALPGSAGSSGSACHPFLPSDRQTQPVRKQPSVAPARHSWKHASLVLLASTLPAPFDVEPLI